MLGYLIKDTTIEERRKIVEESLGNIEAACDGCSQRVVDMYDAYIRGEKELREINMEFNARLHNAKIELQSAEGEGTTITVTFPEAKE